jgi:hypothetical protein
MPAQKRQATPAQLAAKRAAFKRVAEPRIANAVNALGLLAICAD